MSHRLAKQNVMQGSLCVWVFWRVRYKCFPKSLRGKRMCDLRKLRDGENALPAPETAALPRRECNSVRHWLWAGGSTLLRFLPCRIFGDSTRFRDKGRLTIRCATLSSIAYATCLPTTFVVRRTFGSTAYWLRDRRARE